MFLTAVLLGMLAIGYLVVAMVMMYVCTVVFPENPASLILNRFFRR